MGRGDSRPPSRSGQPSNERKRTAGRAEAKEPAYEDGIRYTAERLVIETRAFTNKRTGEIVHVPVGIDPGWGGNPGLVRVKGPVARLRAVRGGGRAGRCHAKLEELWASPRTGW